MTPTILCGVPGTVPYIVPEVGALYEVESGGTVILALYVQPGATQGGVVGRHGDALKVKVSAPPEGGKANRAVEHLVASALGVRRGDVELVGGETTRSKRVRVHGVTEPVVRDWLAGFS